MDESVLPVNEKERRREGKRNIGPRMKYGHANLISFCPYTHLIKLYSYSVSSRKRCIITKIYSIVKGLWLGLIQIEIAF